jgi:hypothetical protein
MWPRSSPQKAYEYYTQSVACIERIRSNIRVDEFRSAFFKNKLGVYEKLIGFASKASQVDGPAKAFFYLESRKARTLADLLVNELESTPSGGDQQTPATLAETARGLALVLQQDQP